MNQDYCSIKKILLEKINASFWWHVTPCDPMAYNKRGKFLSSTYRDAEFYGRPNDEPEKVFVENPVFGFSEREILDQIMPGYENNQNIQNVLSNEYHPNWYKRRIRLDAKMYRSAKRLGYDAIVLICQSGYKSLLKNRKPYSIELNLLNV